MYTVVGSGFGLYGYLPALVESGERVVLPRAYEAKVRAREELRHCLGAIEWAESGEAALDRATAVVIATPPRRQLEVASACAASPRIERLVLEKPLAPTPALAERLLGELDQAKKRYRIGYTLLLAAWNGALAWPPQARSEAVRIDWSFMAHHFAHDLGNWKRFHAQGGGALRFFGVHLVALLAARGYDDVRSSSLEGASEDAPERWQATFTGPRVPECSVRVDSRSPSRRFEILHEGGGRARELVKLADPFDEERPEGGEDRRVSILRRLIGSFAEDDLAYRELYDSTNRLWRKVEAA